MKKYNSLMVSAFIICYTAYVLPQSSSLYMPINIQKAYKKNTRSLNGKPGENYWQNSAGYKIEVKFDPVSYVLSGREEILYFNNSPDTLKEIIVHLFPNYYKKGNVRAFNVDYDDENDGVAIEKLVIDEKEIDVSNGSEEVEYRHSSMKSILPAPILSGQQSVLEISWHYTLNKGSHNRTGAIDSTSFFIAYFFPRIAVYDDIDGWNDFKYTGSAEFYNDFGNFDVSITVPQNFIVWATGELLNPEEVLAEKYYQRYTSAFSSDSIIHIVDSIECIQKNITAGNPQNVWKFRAGNVSDFAFALSDHYLWDASSLVVDKETERRVLVEAAYNKSSKDFYHTVETGKKAIRYMCYEIPALPFPFPKITVFNGLDEMEYPMMVNLLSYDDFHEAMRVTSHEIFHSYFPFYMGINETKYAWMDEGITTFATYLITLKIDSPEYANFSFYNIYKNHIGDFIDIPIFAVSDYVIRPVYYFNSYTKPAVFFLILKDVLGDDVFKKALWEFMNRWNGKHPTPYDLFYTLMDVTGENLDWVIKPWFFEYGYVDLAITKVKQSGSLCEIVVEKKGHYPAPVRLKINFEGGTNDLIYETAAVWKNGSRFASFEKSYTKKIKSVILTDKIFLDADPLNNSIIK